MPDTPSHEALQQKIEKPELKKAQLETENRQYREFIENLEEVFYSLDQDGAGACISPNIERITGYLPKELLGRQFANFVYNEDIDQIMLLSGSPVRIS